MSTDGGDGDANADGDYYDDCDNDEYDIAVEDE
jgi:hypothetical protein